MVTNVGAFAAGSAALLGITAVVAGGLGAGAGLSNNPPAHDGVTRQEAAGIVASGEVGAVLVGLLGAVGAVSQLGYPGGGLAAAALTTTAILGGFVACAAYQGARALNN